MTRKTGSRVKVDGEIISSLLTTNTNDGVEMSYYMVRIHGQSKPIAVPSDGIRDAEAPAFYLNDTDFLSTRSSIAKAIRSHRHDANLSQYQLAELLGVSQNSISNWETEKAVPRFYMVPILVKALGITVKELYGDGPA